jgi:acyl-CoA thioesterase FadM
MRYREAGTAFVVRSMTVRHAREMVYGEPVEGETWVRRMRRDMLTTRETRLRGGGEDIANVSQEWVHVDASLKPTRAAPELVEAFGVHPHGDSVTMPEYTPAEGDLPELRFRAWHTWMDPLAHINHPMYVDFCDEAIARALAAEGICPDDVVPVAEALTFRFGVGADDDVRVQTRLVGRAAKGVAVFRQAILVGDSKVCVDALVARRLLSGNPRELCEVFGT